METFGDRYVAEVSAEGKSLRLISEITNDGVRAVVYDIKAQQEIINELVGDLKDGREKCEECARGLLSRPCEIVWTNQKT
jgi:hypothetical protein